MGTAAVTFNVLAAVTVPKLLMPRTPRLFTPTPDVSADVKETVPATTDTPLPIVMLVATVLVPSKLIVPTLAKLALSAIELPCNVVAVVVPIGLATVMLPLVSVNENVAAVDDSESVTAEFVSLTYTLPVVLAIKFGAFVVMELPVPLAPKLPVPDKSVNVPIPEVEIEPPVAAVTDPVVVIMLTLEAE
jgi:hypothetical protein